MNLLADITGGGISGSSPGPYTDSITGYVVDSSAEDAPDGYLAWHAFSSENPNGWYNNGAGIPSWLSIDAAATITVAALQITATAASGNEGGTPIGFSLYGSADGATWTLLQSWTTSAWAVSQVRAFGLSTPAAYRYWKLVATDTGLANTGCLIGMVGLLDVAPPLPSAPLEPFIRTPFIDCAGGEEMIKQPGEVAKLSIYTSDATQAVADSLIYGPSAPIDSGFNGGLPIITVIGQAWGIDINPATDSTSGTNQYRYDIGVNIPSDAADGDYVITFAGQISAYIFQGVIGYVTVRKPVVVDANVVTMFAGSDPVYPRTIRLHIGISEFEDDILFVLPANGIANGRPVYGTVATVGGGTGTAVWWDGSVWRGRRLNAFVLIDDTAHASNLAGPWTVDHDGPFTTLGQYSAMLNTDIEPASDSRLNYLDISTSSRLASGDTRLNGLAHLDADISSRASGTIAGEIKTVTDNLATMLEVDPNNAGKDRLTAASLATVPATTVDTTAIAIAVAIKVLGTSTVHLKITDSGLVYAAREDGTPIYYTITGDMYCMRHDLEIIFGVENIKKWSLLDGLDPASTEGLASISTRIAEAIAWSTSYINDCLRENTRYSIPLKLGQSAATVVKLAANLAGCDLYSSRGAIDRNPETGEIEDRYQYRREAAAKFLAGIASNKIKLDAAINDGEQGGTNAPFATGQPTRRRYGDDGGTAGFAAP